ncbi:MAG: DsbC family protein [Candidatus Aenigmatarchaeota archaeon]
MKKVVVLVTGLFIVMSMFLTGQALSEEPKQDLKDAEARLKETFKNMPVDSFKESVIPGLYEVVTGTQVIYFSPKGYLFFGEIWDAEKGKSITAERRQEIESKKVKTIPADKAIRIGKGPKKVIEFSDPDCPYCRRASEFFDKRDDVTRYVFFVPLRQIHPNAEKKAKFILCSKDSEKTYKEVYSGKYDKEDIAIPKDCEETSSKMLKEMESIAASVGVTGTPLFYIEGQKVVGANIPEIEKLLGGK